MSLPWLPFLQNTRTAELPRDVAHAWACLSSGLPGSFVYPIFNSRLAASIGQLPGAVSPTGQLDRIAEISYYRILGTLDELLSYVEAMQRAGVLRGTRADPPRFVLRATINLYSSAYSHAREHFLPLPRQGDAFRGEHTVQIVGRVSDRVEFIHNWDNWTTIWSMPVELLRQHFVEAYFDGQVCSDGSGTFDLDPIVSTNYEVNINASRNGSLFSPAGSEVDVHCVSGVAMTGDARILQITSSCVIGNESIILGWMGVKIAADTAHVEELFVHPAMRSMGIARSMVGLSAFFFHCMGPQRIVFHRSRADVAVDTVVPNAVAMPSWLREGWVNVALPGSRAGEYGQEKASSTIELLQATRARRNGIDPDKVGSVAFSAYALASDDDWVGEPDQFHIILDPELIDLSNGDQVFVGTPTLPE